MTFTIRKRHVIAVLIVVLAGAGAFVGVRLSSGTRTSAKSPRLPLVMQCTGKTQTEPTSYVLSCADYNSELLKIHWTSWTSRAATAKATYSFNDCTPYCAAGKFHSYPATVRLSSPRTTKSGLLFAEVSITYSGPSGRKVLAEQLPTTSLAGTASVTTTTAPAPVGSGYLNTASTSAAFIQWDTNGSAVSGTIQLDYIEGTPPNEQLSTNTDPVSGQINGSQISLSFSGGTEQFGTISGGSFTLDVPQSDGTLAPATFQSATAAQFNAAVAVLNNSVSSANAAAKQAQATSNAESTINDDASTVASDIAGLGQDASAATSSLGPFAGALATEKADVIKTAQSEQGVITEAKQYPSGNSGQVCYAASQVSYDASQVSYDASEVEYDATSMENDVTTARNAMGAPQADLTALQKAEVALPSYQPNAPTQAQVNSAVASAQKAVSAAVSQTNAAIDQANAYQTQAYQDAAGAINAGNCGSPPSPPQAQQHIS